MTPNAFDLGLDRVRAALQREYDVLRPLGEGSMGSVFLAKERALGRLVAIKVLNPILGTSPVFRERFSREARAVAALGHPNVVPLFGTGETDGLRWLAMQYVEGTTLAERLRAAAPVPLAEALRIARDVARALAAAHRRGIIHRDVKPGNILLEADGGRALVTDFGIARVDASTERTEDGSDDPLTRLGLAVGTPRYMSPEQASAMPLTAASDLYALGIVLYEMLAGAYPYELQQPPNFVATHLTAPLVPLADRLPDVPAPVEALVHRLLARRADDRLADASALADALDAMLAEWQSSGEHAAWLRPAGPGRRAARWVRRRWRLVLPIALLAIGGMAAAPRLLRERDAPATAVEARRRVLVGFFENATPDRSLDWLRLGGVEYVTQALGRWSEVRTVEPVRLLDLARTASVDVDRPLSQQDALQLARRAGAWTATIGAVVQTEKGFRVVLRVLDVESGTLVRTLQAEAAGAEALPDALGRLAGELLALAGAPDAARAAADPPTRSVAAYQAYVEGLTARSTWDVNGAVQAFETAIRLDSTFALAYYELSRALDQRRTLDELPRAYALADTAVRFAGGLPERDRLLLSAYQRLVRLDLAGAASLYREVLARDSTVVDALVGLADVAWLDRTLVTEAGGVERLPADPETALRLYERALALDGSDHRPYQRLFDILYEAGTPNGILAGYRDPATGDLSTVFLRRPTRRWTLLLRGETIELVPTDSLALRYPSAVVDSLRAAARRRAMTVLTRWQQRAPAEAQPFHLRYVLRLEDRDWDGALADLERSIRLGFVSPVPVAALRVAPLAGARRLREAAAIADSIRGEDPAQLSLRGPLLAMQGRPSALARDQARLDSAFAGLGATQDVQRSNQLGAVLLPLRLAAMTGDPTPAVVRTTLAKAERLMADAPGAERARQRHSAVHVIAFAAALAGDTTVFNAWRHAPGEHEDARELDALARLRSGDRTAAARVLDAVRPEAATTVEQLFARAEVERGLGRAAAAWRTLERLERVAVNADDTAPEEWLLYVRALARRADAAEVIGETDAALRDWRLVRDLWARGETAVRPVQALAAARATALERARDAGSVPLRSRR